MCTISALCRVPLYHTVQRHHPTMSTVVKKSSIVRDDAHNNRFYFSDGSVILQVEKQLFKVHKYFLEKHSPYFRKMLSDPKQTPSSSGTAGLCDAQPIHIPKVTVFEFETLLDSFYSNSLYDDAGVLSSRDHCLALLRAAHRFGMMADSDKMQERIVAALTSSNCKPPIGDFELLALAEKYEIKMDHLLPALESVVGRVSYLTAEETAAQPAITRHARYYLQDGSDVFQIENQLFKVHRFFLTRYSPVFREMLKAPQPKSTSTAGVEGASESATIPIRIPNVTVSEFETLLDSFYVSTFYDEPSALVITAARCFALLRMMHRFGVILDKMQKHAIDALNKCQPPVDDIELLAVAMKCNVRIAYLMPAVERLATRLASLTGAEMGRLPKDMVPKICKVREEVLKQRIWEAQGVHDAVSSPQKTSLCVIL
ncbi:hypothetical protein DENSPDRAFT_931736 [Dentipellis sp. KUC8613]|nr:hypothetical protein DENSPDRAFT_931736 [Dentipellis sp. KUC8613]